MGVPLGIRPAGDWHCEGGGKAEHRRASVLRVSQEPLAEPGRSVSEEMALAGSGVGTHPCGAVLGQRGEMGPLGWRADLEETDSELGIRPQSALHWRCVRGAGEPLLGPPWWSMGD